MGRPLLAEVAQAGRPRCCSRTCKKWRSCHANRHYCNRVGQGRGVVSIVLVVHVWRPRPRMGGRRSVGWAHSFRIPWAQRLHAQPPARRSTGQRPCRSATAGAGPSQERKGHPAGAARTPAAHHGSPGHLVPGIPLVLAAQACCYVRTPQLLLEWLVFPGHLEMLYRCRYLLSCQCPFVIVIRIRPSHRARRLRPCCASR